MQKPSSAEIAAIVCDTREPPHTRYRFEDFPVVVKKLDAGDYSLVGFEDQFCVERKQLWYTTLVPQPKILDWTLWLARYGPNYRCGHARTKENSYDNHDSWRCRECTIKNNSVHGKNAERIRKYWQLDYVKRRNSANAQRYAKQLRLEMIAAYGGDCTCCGERTYEFMTLEHVGGGGNEERRRYSPNAKSSNGANHLIIIRLRREGWPKGKYTVLCANCNMATKYGRTCPHQQNKNSLQS